MALDTIPKQEGGKLKAVASGTLPSGQPVIVNADGTVSVIGSTDDSVGTPVIYAANNIRLNACTFDSTSNKVVVAYRDLDNSNYGTAVVGTVSGTSISFGTAAVFHNTFCASISIAYDVNAQRVVINYRDITNNQYGTSVVGTVSGTSISFGTPVVFNSGGSSNIASVYDVTAQKIVVAWSDISNSNYGAAIVGTVSGTSISFGSEVVFESATTDRISVTYDASAQKVVIAYRDNFNSNYGTAVVGTVSGTSISFGSVAIFESGNANSTSIVYDSNAQKVVIAYQDGDNSDYGTAVVGTVSGTSISFGSPVVFESAASNFIVATYDATAKKVVIAYQDGGNSNYGTAVVGTVSGTSISFGSETVFESDNTGVIASTFDPSSNKVVMVYQDVGNSNYGTAAVFTTGSTNLTSENYIGMSGGVVKTLSQSEAIGTESTFETGDVTASSSGYHVAEKKTLLMFRDQSDSGKIKGLLVTTTGTTLSYGSIVELTGQVGHPGSVVYDSVNEKLVVIFRGNTNYTYAVVATISGSSLTFGTPVVFNSATSSVREGVYDSSSGKIVVLYSAASVSYLKVGTVSGTSISFGSATSLGSGSGMYSGKLAYDPVNNKTIYVQVNDINSDGIAYVGTVSGTSISVGSPTTFNSNLAKLYGAFYDAPSGKTGVIVQTGGGPGEGYVGTVSGTSISFGSGVQFQSSISQGVTGYDSRVNKFTVACREADAPNSGLLRLGTISGNTFSFASPVTFNSGETALDNHGVGFDSDQGTSIISFMDGGDGDVGKAIGFQASGSYVVTAEVADGGNATVDIVGTVSTNQLSLTAGQQYFVQTDGTLGLTAADPSVLAGTAISATKLVVKT